MKAQLLRQVPADKKDALKESFKNNPLLVEALRSLLKAEEEALVSTLASRELLTKRNFDKHLAALLAEVRVYRYLQGMLDD